MAESTDARQRVAAAFPQLEARSVTPIGAGWTVDTYDVDGDVDRAVPAERRTRPSGCARRCGCCRSSPPSCPRSCPLPVYADEITPAMAYHRLDGLPLDQAPDGLWPERLGRFLYDLHLMPPEYVDLRGKNASAVRAAFADELSAMRADVLPLLEPDESERFGARFTAFLDREDYWRFSACLTHGDIGPEHVLVSASGDLVGVLDWEELDVGDPVADFAWLLHARPADGERVLGAYGGAPDPTFAERCGVPVLPHAVPRGRLRAADRRRGLRGQRDRGHPGTRGRRRGLSVRDLRVCGIARPPRP